MDVAAPPPRTSTLRDAVIERYLSLDQRALALFRVYFGLVLFFDVLRRLPQVTLYYSNDGVLSNHFALYAPLSAKPFSLLFGFSTPREVTCAFLAMAACYLALAVGYQTRTMQILAVVFTTSVNQRNTFVEAGGAVVLVLLAVWTVFLPLGATFSIDAYRRRRRAPEPGSGTTVVTLVALGLLIQTAAIYFFNGVQKDGADWKTGHVVHYLLWQNRLATPFAGWLRLHEPGWLSPLLSRATLWMEIAAPFMLFSAFFWQRLRTIHVVSMIGFHLGIAAVCNIGAFSWAMIGLNLLLLPPQAMDVLSTRLGFVADRVRPYLERAGRRLGRERACVIPYGSRIREAAVFVVLSTMVLQIMHENWWLEGRLPASLLRGPGPLTPLIEYGRIGQAWIMFRQAPRDDGRLVVDAVTAGGRHVDVLTGREPDFDAAFHGPWGFSQLDCDYHLKIAWDEHEKYRAELGKHVSRWHEIEGRPPEDRIVSYDVYWVNHQSPPPGFVVPFGVERRLVLSSR